MFQSIFGFKQQNPAAFKNRQVQSQVKTITPVGLQQRLQANEPLAILDVRFPEEYATGHIADSRLLPLPHLRQRSDELPKEQPIVCVCRSGNRSQVACEQLADLGFTNLINLTGGMIGWTQAGLPVQF